MEADFPDVLASPSLTYEEGLRFFRGQGMANDALRRLVADSNACGIDYSVIGAIASNLHGYRRFTEDIGLLMSPEDLVKFQTELVGRAYCPAFPGATKKFRDRSFEIPARTSPLKSLPPVTTLVMGERSPYAFIHGVNVSLSLTE